MLLHQSTNDTDTKEQRQQRPGENNSGCRNPVTKFLVRGGQEQHILCARGNRAYWQLLVQYSTKPDTKDIEKQPNEPAPAEPDYSF
mmetsp:Transcript_20320/g.50552  ORF Transcript_20320/g.50552 Transcript_20320/m.50552 type:complete len:86 (+) Transcript_20320:447-704(+)